MPTPSSACSKRLGWTAAHCSPTPSRCSSRRMMPRPTRSPTRARPTAPRWNGPMTAPLQLFTIGFTRKSAEAFFTSLREAGVRRLVDVRLNNISQLAGFTKKDDLRYFLKAIAGIEYLHLGELAPT